MYVTHTDTHIHRVYHTGSLCELGGKVNPLGEVFLTAEEDLRTDQNSLFLEAHAVPNACSCMHVCMYLNDLFP